MKNIGNAFALIVVSLIIIGVFNEFLVNEKIIKYLIISGFSISAFLLLLIFRRLMATGSQYRQNMEAQGKSPVGGVIAITLFLPFMIVTAFYKGLPVFLNFIFGQPGSLIVTISEKPAIYYSKRCPGKLYLTEYKSFMNNKICNVSESDWKYFSNGEKIQLVGNGSVFGFDYSSYKKIVE